MGSTIIFVVTVFYVTLISILTLAGFVVSDGEEIVTFPEFLSVEIPVLSSVPFVGSIVNFIVVFIPNIFILFAYIIQIVKFSLTDLLPVWLNTILFLPLGFIIIYEFIARMARGSGG